MPEPVQATIYGATEPLRASDEPVRHDAPSRLFDAPQTIRGQLALDTAEPTKVQAAP